MIVNGLQDVTLSINCLKSFINQEKDILLLGTRGTPCTKGNDHVNKGWSSWQAVISHKDMNSNPAVNTNILFVGNL